MCVIIYPRLAVNKLNSRMPLIIKNIRSIFTKKYVGIVKQIILHIINYRNSTIVWIQFLHSYSFFT